MAIRQVEKRLNFKQVDWKIPLVICIACLYAAVIGYGLLRGIKFLGYRGDYLAFWSVGKIANEKGYSEIYDLNNLQSVQSDGVKSLGFIAGIDGPSNPTIPVPYFSFFVIPFQLLAKIPLIFGYWLWTTLNFVILIGYSYFFLQKFAPGKSTRIPPFYLLSILLVSYPVFINFLSAQVEVLLVICAGEFIRSSMGKKPMLSGIWLGGLLLKPQLLVLIIPTFFLLRNWKVLYGFFVSSGIILLISSLLSGLSGMQALIKLWTKYSVGMASNSPFAMINWRMIGINLNTFTSSSFGWVFTVIGMLLTTFSLYFLIKKNPPFGSNQWLLSMLGIFCATIAVTWHSHYHMTLILIPFLIFSIEHALLPAKIIFSWALVTPMILFGIMFVDLFLQVVFRTNGLHYDVLIVTAISGFVSNIVVLISSLRSSNKEI